MERNLEKNIYIYVCVKLNHIYIPDTNTMLQNIYTSINQQKQKMPGETLSSIPLSDIQNALALQLNILIML